VEEAIRHWDENDLNLIVELNHRFVHPDTYGSIRLREGDRLELINPAFGG
jgi:sulfur carrier protein ThiS